MESLPPGEFDLIARLTRQLPARPDVALGVGDDCAILDLHGVDTLATCDSQVEGVHFTLAFSSPEQIGRKALAVNPHLDKVPELVKTLSEKVEGRDI